MTLPRRALLAAPLAAAASAYGGERDGGGGAGNGGADMLAAVPRAVRTDLYVVEGRTRREVQASIVARGPSAPAAGGGPAVNYAGRTTWRVDWASATLATPAGVTLRGFDVFVQVRHTLPRWEKPAVVSASAVAAWDRYLADLTAHERGHADIGLAAAAAMLAALAPALAPGSATAWTAPTAAALAARLDARCEKILEVYRVRETEYDRLTDHGRRAPPRTWSAGVQ